MERRRAQDDLLESLSNRRHVPGVQERAMWSRTQEARLEANVGVYRNSGGARAAAQRAAAHSGAPERAGEWMGADFYARRSAADAPHDPRLQNRLSDHDHQLDRQRRYNTPAIEAESVADTAGRTPGGPFGGGGAGFQHGGADGLYNEHGRVFTRGKKHYEDARRSQDSARPLPPAPWELGGRVVDARGSMGASPASYRSPAAKAGESILAGP
jgi:hypothetical protein